MEISEQIRQRRAAAGLSQEELAERIYVTRQTLSNWETGKTYPDLNSLLRLGDVFHVSLDELVKGDIAAMEEEIKKEDTSGFEKENRILLVLLAVIFVLGVVQILWDSVFSILVQVLDIALLIWYAYRVDKLQSKYAVSSCRQIIGFLKGKQLDELASEAEKENRRCRRIVLTHAVLFTVLILIVIADALLNQF